MARVEHERLGNARPATDDLVLAKLWRPSSRMASPPWAAYHGSASRSADRLEADRNPDRRLRRPSFLPLKVRSPLETQRRVAHGNAAIPGSDRQWRVKARSKIHKGVGSTLQVCRCVPR